jgi:DNA polymerase
MENCQNILHKIDWPTDILVLDFESYFDQNYHLGKGKGALSIVEYITSPRFRFTGLGVQFNNNEPRFIPGPYIPYMIGRLKEKFGKALHNCTVVAKNNKFDCLILVEKFGIYPPYTIDIEDLSRYFDSRMRQGLKNLCKLFKLPAKGDTKQFKGLYWETMTPEQRLAMKEYCLGDITNEKSLLEILLPMLDNPGDELNLARHTLNLFLKPILNLDITQANQIASNMDTALSEDLQKVAWVLKYRTKAKPNIPKIMRAKKIFPQILQDVLPEGEAVPMKQGKNQMIPATAQNDVAFQYLLAHKDQKVRDLCRAKAACSSWPLHQSKVHRMIAQAKCCNGLIRMPLKYYGAHTGRWSGTGGWNPMNLGGKGRGRPIHPLIAQVRGTLMAPDGYTLIIVDSAQIEARELAWVAHQDDLLKGFANGEDIYSVFATELFQEKVWKPTEEEKKTPEGQTADIRRGFGKDAILGCGFGMGANTFFDRCRQNDTLRPLFDSGKYDWDFIDRLIKTYRSKYVNIPAFWDEIAKCFRWPTKYPRERTVYRISEHAELVFFRQGSITKMQLPSGRVMNYRHATVSPKDNGIKYLHGHLWGGSITENLIQAMCRCLLGYWWLACEAVGIKIVLNSYDELVGCVPKETAEKDLQTMIDIMCSGPEWANGLPLAAEGMISERYCK